jgi:hydrogenase expression/formation protein HypD
VRYVDEFRSTEGVQKLVRELHAETTRSWTIMEVCGGQTHTIVKTGIDGLLPKSITLVHGPGCPVCVTPLELIDKAVAIASRADVIFTSFGDMLRVPGSEKDLLTVKAQGGDVRVVYSPLDAVNIAQENPHKQVVFFAVGFETTAPANAFSVSYARDLGVSNYSLLVSHVLVPPAMRAILGSPANRVQGFLAAGHVCTVMGYEEYEPIAERYRVPIVVTGFEPTDIMQGILMTVRQLESGSHLVENQYVRAVKREGNLQAQDLLKKVFDVVDRSWRGIGEIPKSGYALRKEFTSYDAELRFDVRDIRTAESTVCIAGQIMQGMKKPSDCPVFGSTCTPEHPLGAPMVSSEGACAAYFQYARVR